jgi:hypothetical protein
MAMRRREIKEHIHNSNSRHLWNQQVLHDAHKSTPLVLLSVLMRHKNVLIF